MVIRGRQSTNRQYNGQTKENKWTNDDLHYTNKQTIEKHESR